MQEYIEMSFFYSNGGAEQAFNRLLKKIGEADGMDYKLMDDTSATIATEPGPIDVSLTPDKRQNYFECTGSIITVLMHCYLVTGEEGTAWLEGHLDFVQKVYAMTSPVYVCGMHIWTMEGIGIERPSPVTDQGLANNRIDLPTWLMIFPPEMVEEYGREWLLDLPAERIEELDDGGIMVVATQDFVDTETVTEFTNRVYDAVEPLKTAFRDRG